MAARWRKLQSEKAVDRVIVEMIRFKEEICLMGREGLSVTVLLWQERGT